MRAKVLDMFLAYSNTMYVFNLKSDMITNPAKKEEAPKAEAPKAEAPAETPAE